MIIHPLLPDSFLLEYSLVPLAVSGREDTVTPRFVVLPVSLVYFAVGPGVLSEARHFVVSKVAYVDAAICEDQRTLSVLLSVGEQSVVLGSVGQ